MISGPRHTVGPASASLATVCERNTDGGACHDAERIFNELPGNCQARWRNSASSQNERGTSVSAEHLHSSSTRHKRIMLLLKPLAPAQCRSRRSWCQQRPIPASLCDHDSTTERCVTLENCLDIEKKALTLSQSVVASSCVGQLVVRNAFYIISTKTPVGDKPAAFVDDRIERDSRAIRERCPGGLIRQGISPMISSSVRWRSVSRSNRYTVHVTAISCRSIEQLPERRFTQHDLLRFLLPRVLTSV